jgi:hypothetical protein
MWSIWLLLVVAVEVVAYLEAAVQVAYLLVFLVFLRVQLLP